MTHAQTLSLKQVLDSARQHYPKIQAMKHAQLKAVAKAQSAQGNLDLRLSAKGEVQPSGFYQGSDVLTQLEQPTTLWGTSFQAGWRQGKGSFPSYEGRRLTGQSGEIFAGLTLPLLRGGLTDPGRTEISVTQAESDQATAELDSTLLHALLNASVKYWKWVEATKKLEIANSLLLAAQERQVWIKARVKAGDVPAMEAVDNERSILGRRTKVVEAEQEVLTQAIELSLYYRNELGLPQIAKTEQAPPDFPKPRSFPQSENVSRTQQALTLRPELREVAAKSQANEAELTLAQTEMLPTLDFYSKLSRDLGAVDRNREGTEIEAGVVFKIPLERRKARGMLAAAREERMKIEAQLRLIGDELKADVSRELASLEATYQQVILATKEVELNHQLVEGERTRFKQGDSHIMFVNIRELSLGDSRLSLVQAQAKHQQALARLLAVTGEILENTNSTESTLKQ